MRDAAKAVDFGWKELPGGGIEYQVQVEPELIQTFEKQGFASEIPPGLHDIRAIRITTGRVTLPNQGDLDGPKVAAAASSPKSTPTNTVADSGEQNRTPKVPNTLNDVMTAGATEVAQLLNPNGTGPAPAPRYSLTPPLGSETNNGATNEGPANSSPPSNFPANNFPANSTTSGSTNNFPRTSNPANSGTNNSAPGNNPTDPMGRPSSLNEAANPKNGFWPNVSSLSSQGQPTPAGVPTDTRAGSFANSPANASRDSTVVDTFGNHGSFANPSLAMNEGLKTDFKPEVSQPEAAKPWMPLMLALMALFASLAANVYLVWLHQEIRFKYFPCCGACRTAQYRPFSRRED